MSTSRPSTTGPTLLLLTVLVLVLVVVVVLVLVPVLVPELDQLLLKCISITKYKLHF